MPLGGLRPSFRQFFSGIPIWKVNDESFAKHPQGYSRAMDSAWGSFYWVHDGNICFDGGNKVWDGTNFWHPDQSQQEPQHNETGLQADDLYD